MTALVTLEQSRTKLWSWTITTAARTWHRFGYLHEAEARACAREFCWRLSREPKFI